MSASVCADKSLPRSTPTISAPSTGDNGLTTSGMAFPDLLFPSGTQVAHRDIVDADGPYYLGLAAASNRARGTQRAVSASTNAVNSSGDIDFVPMASSASRVCTSGNCIALTVSRLSCATI